MKTKMYFLIICLINAMTSVYAYDFEALNEDDVPIYYNFSEDGTSVVVTHKYMSVDEIEDYFLNESYSGNVVIPESVMYDSQSFNVTEIGEYAFYICFGLTGITIPNNIITIGKYAFVRCDGLMGISIPNSVITIGERAFGSCGLTEISIPNSVITITEAAFSGCVNLTAVTIGENVNFIGAGAFYGCKITNIIIPENVVTIEAGVFNTCLNLSEFIVSEQNMNYSTIDGVLFSKDQSVLVAYPNAKSSVYTIPDCVSIIGVGAFHICENLIDVTIPESVTSIEVSAFYGTNLNNIIIPVSVATIGNYAFGACYELKKVIIPNSDISFGDRVFYGDEALEEIHNLSPIPQSIGSLSFTFVDKNRCKLYVPKGSLSAYETADVWKQFNHIIEEDYVSITPISKENISVFTIQGGISVGCNELVQVAIFNMTGQEVYQSIFRGYKEIILGQGLYIVRINGESRKIMIK